MDARNNPFAPGAGNPPPELAGRQAILDSADVLLGRVVAGRPSQSMIMVGLRGVGKTVLLTEVRKLAEAAEYEVVNLEAHDGKTLPELLIPSLKEVLFRLCTIEQAKSLARRGLRILRSFIGSLSVTMDGVPYGLTVEPETGTADTGDLEADLPRVMIAIAEAAKEAGRPIVLLVDEIQYLETTEFSALIMGLHQINQRQLPFAMVGAGLPQTLALAGNSKSYAERLFRYPDVGALDPDDARRAIVLPAQQENADFADNAVEEILEVTERYPYFLQQWAYEAWNVAENPFIELSDVHAAHSRAIGELDQGFFKVRFDRCTPAERRYMRALAELGPGTQRSGDVAEQLGVKVTSQGPVRNSLIKKGMIYAPAHGDMAFTVPLFDQYIKRVMPEFDR